VGDQFVREIRSLALACALPVRERDVELTFSVTNDAAREATFCYRLKGTPAAIKSAAPVFKGMRRSYTAERDGEAYKVSCVLTGGVGAKGYFDWAGAPVESVG